MAVNAPNGLEAPKKFDLRGRRSETGATGASAYTLLVKRFRTAGIFVVDVRAGTEVLRRAGAAAPRHLAEIYPPYDIRPQAYPEKVPFEERVRSRDSCRSGLSTRPNFPKGLCRQGLGPSP